MAENEPMLRRIGAALREGDPVEVLARELPATDLSSLWLHVLAARSGALEAGKLLDRYEALRAAQPGPSDPRRLLELSAQSFAAASAFDAVEVGPVLPLGAARALGGVHQNNVLGAVRGLEVVADTSNALALEAARRRRALPHPRRLETVTRLCGEHRVLRMQPLPDPRLLPHFRLFALASAGRDGARPFALDAAREHLAVYLDLFRKLSGRGYPMRSLAAQVTDTEVVLWLLQRAGVSQDALRREIRAHHFGGSAGFLAARGIKLPETLQEVYALADLPVRLRSRLERLDTQVCTPLRHSYPEVAVSIDLTRLEGLGYYSGLALRVAAISAKEERFPLADGGSLDWTARLLGDRRERLLASGYGPDLLYLMFRT